MCLQLSNESYEQVAHFGRAVKPTFAGGGLSRRRVYKVTGRDRRGRQIRQYSDVRIHDLERVEFDRAILIDAPLWSEALEYWRDQMLRGKGDPGMGPPEAFAVSLDQITEADLYLDAEDIERLKVQILEREGHGNYPFDHKERMPGIYLMFQAAWLLNEKREAIDPKAWIASEAKRRGLTLTDKEIRAAAKFSRLEFSRTKGGGKEEIFRRLTSLVGMTVPSTDSRLSAAGFRSCWLSLTGGMFSQEHKLRRRPWIWRKSCCAQISQDTRSVT